VEERAPLDSDFEELWRLHVATMGAYVGATWGWDEADQRRRFREAWPEVKAGRLSVSHGAIAAAWRTKTAADHVWLSALEVAAAWQGRGIGSQIVLRVVSEAAAKGLPTQLQVLKVNTRAARLYLRLGFTQIAATATHYELSSRPEAPVSAGLIHDQ
jgi:GNAT superfamily N-acetyltransferase